MTQPDQQPPPARPAPADRASSPQHAVEQFVKRRYERRREKIQAEIRRNRAGGHRVPTWVLAALLALILGAWALLIIVS